MLCPPYFELPVPPWYYWWRWNERSAAWEFETVEFAEHGIFTDPHGAELEPGIYWPALPPAAPPR